MRTNQIRRSPTKQGFVSIGNNYILNENRHLHIIIYLLIFIYGVHMITGNYIFLQNTDSHQNLYSLLLLSFARQKLNWKRQAQAQAHVGSLQTRVNFN